LTRIDQFFYGLRFTMGVFQQGHSGRVQVGKAAKLLTNQLNMIGSCL